MLKEKTSKREIFKSNSMMLFWSGVGGITREMLRCSRCIYTRLNPPTCVCVSRKWRNLLPRTHVQSVCLEIRNITFHSHDYLPKGLATSPISTSCSFSQRFLELLINLYNFLSLLNQIYRSLDYLRQQRKWSSDFAVIRIVQIGFLPRLSLSLVWYLIFF